MAAVKGTRAYSSSLRARQAEATRQAVLDAARDLFVAHGYSATTIEQIATRAGVSKPTVFTAVGNKATLLKLVRDRAIAGDDEPVAIAQRDHVEQISDETDLRQASALLARHLTEVARRYGAVHEVIRAAADRNDDAVRYLWRTEEEQRLTGARHWIDLLAKKRRGSKHVDRATAADVLWLLMSPETYERLVNRRGWTRRGYERWLTDAITGLVDP
jgi:AcrR family transcriptional regulator